ncbi:MAG: hypothetical protein JJ896_15470 [Rhodothermales bacterium]|nr:hypothetical protein [Rhodothermales bacterium]MBO6781054.1 hypothetical protein [Rhodothermales bacterium]
MPRSARQSFFVFVAWVGLMGVTLIVVVLWASSTLQTAASVNDEHTTERINVLTAKVDSMSTRLTALERARPRGGTPRNPTVRRPNGSR